MLLAYSMCVFYVHLYVMDQTLCLLASGSRGCRSFQFYLSIEQALLCGDPLLVEGVASPIDPALQPLLEMGHTWDGKGTCTLYMTCTDQTDVYTHNHVLSGPGIQVN